MTLSVSEQIVHKRSSMTDIRYLSLATSLVSQRTQGRYRCISEMNISNIENLGQNLGDS